MMLDPRTNTSEPEVRPLLPWVVAPSPYDFGESDGMAIDRARTLLAGLLRSPITHISILDHVGRVYLLEYESLGKPDPDIIICDFPSAKPINRLLLELQNARGLHWLDWNEFWHGINWYIEELQCLTAGHTGMVSAERAFVLAWAYRIRDTGAVIA
jgi:hypothetical protein